MKFARTMARLQQGLERDEYRGAQCHLSVEGRPELMLAVGEAHPGQPMGNDTILPVFCLTKPLVAVAALHVLAQHGFGEHTPLRQLLPELAPACHPDLAVAHLLTHTAGVPRTVGSIPPADSYRDVVPYAPDMELPLDIVPPGPDVVPGRTASYSYESAWTLLGRVVERLTGRPLGQVVREVVLDPLGMVDTHLQVSATEYRRIADRLGAMYMRRPLEGTTSMMGDAEGRARRGAAGWGGHSTARDLAQFFEALAGCRSPSPGGADFARWGGHCARPWRQGLTDWLYGSTAWGLGVICDRRYFSHRACSDATFGHDGIGSSLAVADPATGVVLVLVFDTIIDPAQAGLRNRKLVTTIMRDLHHHAVEESLLTLAATT